MVEDFLVYFIHAEFLLLYALNFIHAYCRELKVGKQHDKANVFEAILKPNNEPGSLVRKTDYMLGDWDSIHSLG